MYNRCEASYDGQASFYDQAKQQLGGQTSSANKGRSAQQVSHYEDLFLKISPAQQASYDETVFMRRHIVYLVIYHIRYTV